MAGQWVTTIKRLRSTGLTGLGKNYRTPGSNPPVAYVC